MIRRLSLAISINIFKEFPIVQIIIITVICWIVVIHLIIYRPYVTKSTNLIQISVEICVAVSYTAAGLLISDNINKEPVGWTIFISVNLSYIIQLIHIIFTALKKLHAKIQARRGRNRTSPAYKLDNSIMRLSDIQREINTKQFLQD
jgi:hypothetical protein